MKMNNYSIALRQQTERLKITISVPNNFAITLSITKNDKREMIQCG